VGSVKVWWAPSRERWEGGGRAVGAGACLLQGLLQLGSVGREELARDEGVGLDNEAVIGVG
jgi:hypothetical protein